MRTSITPLSDPSRRWHRGCWIVALAALLAFIFAVAALSGPGRIDIVDGQARYAAAGSLIDYGDDSIRDARVWFGVFPGRGGRLYTVYRFPQTVLGAAAIWMADLTGPSSEPRRHFFFVLTSALAAGLLAVSYAVVFRQAGHRPWAAAAWAIGGILCTPSWFYATSTFDDILGAAAIVGAVTIALVTRHRRVLLGAAAAGLMLGLAFNCKQPLGAFALVVLAAQIDRRQPLRRQWDRLALVAGGLVLGVLVCQGYHLYKFPPGSTEQHAELLQQYAPNFPGNPLAAVLGLSLSPAAGALWYCPPLLIAVAGMRAWYGREKWLCLAMLTGSGVFVLFVSALTIFKGDPSWGPRYLTPVFALWWLFVPAGARVMGPRVAPALLACGMLVQLAGLSVDPHRLYVERDLPSAFGVVRPWLYFHPAVSHLANRPREIVEVCRRDRPSAGSFSPSAAPTFAFPIIDTVPGGPQAVRSYHVLNSLRPWWASQQFLAPAERPVDLHRTAALLLLTAALSLFALSASCACLRGTGPDRNESPPHESQS